MTFQDLLTNYRQDAFNKRDQGDRFERLMQAYLLTEPIYQRELENVWLWSEFPGRETIGGQDTGIDLVAQTKTGNYWAVQCKFYGETSSISKSEVDAFLSISGRAFKIDGKQLRFSQRLWISTTNNWSSNAEATLRDQDPPVNRINLSDLQESAINWAKYRKKFENDLKKSLPRLPLVDSREDFWAFSRAGRKLGELHANYESVPPNAEVKVTGADSGNFRVQKMCFPKKDQKHTIIYNSSIKLENIPAKAYEYVVNGKSAIECIMERYQVKVDKKSGIKNDPRLGGGGWESSVYFGFALECYSA